MTVKPIPLSDIVNSKVNKPQEEMPAGAMLKLIQGHDPGAPQPAPEQQPAPMKLHISISKYGKNGDAFHLDGDVQSMEDLERVREQFEGYMPRKRLLWGLL